MTPDPRIARRPLLTGALALAAGAAVRPLAAGAPARVAALEYTLVEYLLALDHPVAAMADKSGYRRHVGIGTDRLAAARDLGTRQEPNLAALTAVDPDLILAVRFRHAGLRARLREIAPVHMSAPFARDRGRDAFDHVMADFAAVARRLDATAAAERAAQAAGAAFDRAAAALSAAGADGAPAVILHSLGQGRLRVFTADSTAMAVARRIGLNDGFDADGARFGFVTRDIETLATLPQDAHVFLIAPDGDRRLARFLDGPVGRRLGYVQAGRLHRLPLDTWLFCGPLSGPALARRLAGRIAG